MVTAKSPEEPAHSPGADGAENAKLFNHLADKTQELLKTFTELSKCHYANKKIGNSNQDEQMTCDCAPELSAHGENTLCGPDSDCINRLTSVECVNDDCTCGDNCQNQRFQRRQYAKVSVISTERKGYGLRADADIPLDSFIYEYMGDVIDETAFRDRMVKYDSQGYKHFYFMMLQKNEFIDATLRGCLLRFCNHSCRPNAFVDKWVVGSKLKMGIFSKRRIVKGEEITFDYNVDRYGLLLQPCYCGESNCIGFMGGKTQTESASLLPQIVAELLGVTPAQEKDWLKMMSASGRKIKKEEDSNINEEFIASLQMSPLATEEVSKVMSALLRSQEVVICRKLIERIHLSADTLIHTRVIRMHGYEIFSTLIKDNWANPQEQLMTLHLLEILSRWPKLTRNKISSSKIEHVLKELVRGTADDHLRRLLQKLLDAWSSLEMAYRIPKRHDAGAGAQKGAQTAPNDALALQVKLEHLPPSRVYENEPLPAGWEWATLPEANRVYFFNRELNTTQWNRPQNDPPPAAKLPSIEHGFSLKRGRDDDDDGEPQLHEHPRQIPAKPAQQDKLDKEQRALLRLQRELMEREASRQLRELELQRIEEELRRKQDVLNSVIQRLQRDAEEKRELEQRLRERELELRRVRKMQKLQLGTRTGAGTAASSLSRLLLVKQKQLKTLFASVVPNYIKKFELEIGHDNVKRCAKDIVTILVEKETKRHSDAEVPSQLSDDKKAKIKIYLKGYMEKFLVKYRAKELKRS